MTYLTLITSAGSDTTATAIGWAGSLLSEHPDQRRELVQDPSLIPVAFEEVLRCEPPTYHFCRSVAHDVEFHGQTVPAGSVLVVVPPAANRDERKWDDPDRFDIHREPAQIFTFGSAPTSVSGPTWPGSRARLRSRRSCRASPSGPSSRRARR